MKNSEKYRREAMRGRRTWDWRKIPSIWCCLERHCDNMTKTFLASMWVSKIAYFKRTSMPWKAKHFVNNWGFGSVLFQNNKSSLFHTQNIARHDVVKGEGENAYLRWFCVLDNAWKEAQAHTKTSRIRSIKKHHTHGEKVWKVNPRGPLSPFYYSSYCDVAKKRLEAPLASLGNDFSTHFGIITQRDWKGQNLWKFSISRNCFSSSLRFVSVFCNDNPYKKWVQNCRSLLVARMTFRFMVEKALQSNWCRLSELQWSSFRFFWLITCSWDFLKDF